MEVLASRHNPGCVCLRDPVLNIAVGQDDCQRHDRYGNSGQACSPTGTLNRVLQDADEKPRRAHQDRAAKRSRQHGIPKDQQARADNASADAAKKRTVVAWVSQLCITGSYAFDETSGDPCRTTGRGIGLASCQETRFASSCEGSLVYPWHFRRLVFFRRHFPRTPG